MESQQQINMDESDTEMSDTHSEVEMTDSDTDVSDKSDSDTETSDMDLVTDSDMSEEDDEEDVLDIVSELLERDMEHVLQKIFLYLDRAGLTASKGVCRRWAWFVQKRIWRGRKCRAILDRRLEDSWRKGVYRERLLKMGGVVRCVTSDEHILVCGIRNMPAQVMDMSTGTAIFQLDCGLQDDMNVAWSKVGEVIYTGSQLGLVTAWSRQNGKMLASKMFSELAVEFIGDVCVAGSTLLAIGNGKVVIVSCERGQLVEVGKLGEGNNRTDNNDDLVDNNGEEVDNLRAGNTRAVDCDGNWIVTGGSDGVQLWKLDQVSSSPSSPIKQLNTGSVESLVLRYPLVVTCGGRENPGMGVWHLGEGHQQPRCLRWFRGGPKLSPHRYVSNYGQMGWEQVRSNGIMVAARDVDSPNNFIVFNLDDCIKNVSGNDVRLVETWRGILNLGKTSLIKCQDANRPQNICIQDFWNIYLF